MEPREHEIMAATRPETLSVSVVQIDYCMKQNSVDYEFVEAFDTSVPVVRIFGSTPTGQRACVYIHGALPYMYFRPLDMSHASFASRELVERYAKKSLLVLNKSYIYTLLCVLVSIEPRLRLIEHTHNVTCGLLL
jgi:hypothetical protein